MAYNQEKIISVVLINFNKENYVERCIKSLLNQTYKNFEIIAIDNKSTDKSYKILSKYKNKIKIIQNSMKNRYGSYDQMNAISIGLKYCKGEILCFLDSDDFFKKDKLKNIFQTFKNNSNINLLYDLPIYYFNYKKKYKQKYLISGKNFIRRWPIFFPHSCISVKTKYLRKVFNILKIKKYNDVWFDFRLSIKNFLDKKRFLILNKHLTFYQQSSLSVSSDFEKYSKKWWERRYQAHLFVDYLEHKNKLLSFDKIFTKLITYFI